MEILLGAIASRAIAKVILPPSREQKSCNPEHQIFVSCVRFCRIDRACPRDRARASLCSKISNNSAVEKPPLTVAWWRLEGVFEDKKFVGPVIDFGQPQHKIKHRHLWLK